MTALDPARDGTACRPSHRLTIDLTAVTPPRGRDADGTDAHLLRLCLDLQLDALMLTLGAAAAQQRREDGDPASGGSDAVPWRRWVEEDVDVAVRLACDAMAGHAALPSTLGSELDHQVPATVVDNLVARYESMSDLLTDLLGRHAPQHDDTWRPRVRDALHRCRTRLVELRAYRLAGTPPRGVRLPDHEYLPGELLG